MAIERDKKKEINTPLHMKQIIINLNKNPSISVFNNFILHNNPLIESIVVYKTP